MIKEARARYANQKTIFEIKEKENRNLAKQVFIEKYNNWLGLVGLPAVNKIEIKEVTDIMLETTMDFEELHIEFRYGLRSGVIQGRVSITCDKCSMKFKCYPNSFRDIEKMLFGLFDHEEAYHKENKGG